MTTVSVLFCLLTQAKPVDKYTLDLYQGVFVARKGAWVSRLPVKLDPPKPPLSVQFRKNDTYAVWDERGLTVRTGRKTVSSLLTEIPVSPRAFTRQQILENLRFIRSGERTKEATALSGARRMGNDVYFLARWDDKAGKPWMEALVKVDLTAEKPHWQFVGRFDGLSLARQPIEDRLGFINGNLSVLVKQADAWGLASFSPTDHLFNFRRLGDRLDQYQSGGLFTETTPYGSIVGGKANLKELTREVLFECQGKAKFLDEREPFLAVIQEPTGSMLRNVGTGAQVALPASAAVRRTGNLVVVWSPFDRPRSAILYSPTRWEVLARWSESDR